jgi:hypothetical protein
LIKSRSTARTPEAALKMNGNTASVKTMIVFPETPTPKKITTNGASATSGLA